MKSVEKPESDDERTFNETLKRMLKTPPTPKAKDKPPAPINKHAMPANKV